MTTFIPRRIEAKASKAGKTYWEIETDQGKATCFDYADVQIIEQSIGKPISSYDIETNEKGFSNIRKHREGVNPRTLNPVMAQPIIQAPVAESKDMQEARKAKDVSIYTSYAKDMFIYLQGKTEKDMEIAIALVKQARKAFE